MIAYENVLRKLLLSRKNSEFFFIQTTVMLEKHKYPKNSRGALVAAAESERKTAAVFQVPTVSASITSGPPSVSWEDGFPSLKQLIWKKGDPGVDSESSRGEFYPAVFLLPRDLAWG